MVRGGAYDAKYEDEGYRQMLEVRIALEGRAVAQAARYLTPETESKQGPSLRRRLMQRNAVT